MSHITSPPLKVLISGAGIAGPCLAYWLAKTPHNIDITVVERHPAARTTGQSIDIHGAAIEITKRMKLEEQIRARSTTEVGCKMIDPSGNLFAQFDVGGFLTAEYEILRGDLAQLFMNASMEMPNVNYKFGQMIKHLKQNDDEVQVSFADGNSATYDLIVAADGGASRTRDMFLDESITKDSYTFVGQYIAYFSIPTEKGDDLFGYWFSAPQGLSIMTRPHRTRNTRGAYFSISTPVKGQPIAEIEEALKDGVEAQKAVLHKYFKNVGWQAKRVLAGMDASDDFYMSKSGRVKLPQWTNNRAVAIGDAAHAIMGTGTDLAIQGAFQLAGEISNIKDTRDIPAALVAFEKGFRPVFNSMDGMKFGYPYVLFPYTSWGLSIRNTMLKILSMLKLHKLMSKESGHAPALPVYAWRDS